jgi:hypothetical protein
VGLRPKRDNLDLSGREFLQGIYGEYGSGSPGQVYVASILGLVATWFRGVQDRTVLLNDQRLDLGPKINLTSSVEADFDVGSSTAPARGSRG